MRSSNEATLACISSFEENTFSNTMRQIGFSFGIALLGAALQLSSNGDYLAAFIVAGASTLALTAIVYWLMDGKQAA